MGPLRNCAKEIQVYADMGAHVVGHTLAHELPVFRKAGVRLASVGIISNHAEGRDEWVGDNPDAMADFYFSCPHFLGPVMANAMEALIGSGARHPKSRTFTSTGWGSSRLKGPRKLAGDTTLSLRFADWRSTIRLDDSSLTTVGEPTVQS